MSSGHNAMKIGHEIHEKTRKVKTRLVKMKMLKNLLVLFCGVGG
jgi:hypothetical protein